MKKTITATIWTIVAIFIIFTFLCVFAGAGYLLNVFLGIPFVLGIGIYVLLEILIVVLICWIEGD